MKIFKFGAIKVKEAEKRFPNTVEYVRKNLVPNVRCNRCGKPVLKSEAPERGYVYQCMSCDEDLFAIETSKSASEVTDEELAVLIGDSRVLELDEDDDFVNRKQELLISEDELLLKHNLVALEGYKDEHMDENPHNNISHIYFLCDANKIADGYNKELYDSFIRFAHSQVEDDTSRMLVKESARYIADINGVVLEEVG